MVEIIDDPFGIYDFDESAQELHEAIYAAIQWQNGQQSHKKSPGIMGKGGFFINSREQRKAAALPPWKEDEVTFESGESETGPAATKARIAFIRSRRCWQSKVDGRMVYSHWNDYSKGKTGKQQWIVGVEGCAEIFVLSVKGTTGMAIESAINEHMKKVVSAARQLAKKNLPPYAFWVEISGGEFVKVGQGMDSSWVTPPHVILPEKVDKDFLVSSFVGAENLELFQQAFLEGETWAQRWNSKDMVSRANNTEADDAYDVPQFAGDPQQRTKATIAAAWGSEPTRGGGASPDRSSVEDFGSDSIPF